MDVEIKDRRRTVDVEFKDGCRAVDGEIKESTNKRTKKR